MVNQIQELAEYARDRQPEIIESADFQHGALTIVVKPDSLPKMLGFLHDDANCQFRMLMDVTAVDYPGRVPRFDVVYQLLSLQLNQRITLKVAVDEQMPVPTATQLFPSAAWYEREVWDLYGIVFSGNPDLRRILTDYGFSGHPLRKDFPLTGFVEMRYDETQKRVLYEPVKLPQAYRDFDFLSPWEGGVDYLLPGDEKADKGAA